MDQEITTPDGIAEAQQSAAKQSARLIAFPDGITRHITLPGWQWAVLDRFDRPDSFTTAARIVEIIFETAKEDLKYPEEPFEEKLRYHISVCLTEGVCWTSEFIQRNANDC